MEILFDVDNTLLDNDSVTADLGAYLARTGGAEPAKEYFRILESLRAELGYADYLGTLQRYRAQRPRDFPFFGASRFLVGYPFTERLYPRALEVLEHANRIGTPAILSDGDAVFQPIKIARAGLAAAVGDRVEILIHKEQELDAVAARFPAEHYVVVDDKRRLLEAIKRAWGRRVTTVWVRQGHYATAPDVASYAEPDLSLAAIAEFTRLSRQTLLEAAAARSHPGRP